MHWLDDSAWEAALERQRPHTLRARLRNTWSSVRRPPGPRVTRRNIWRAVSALWPLWLGLLIVVAVYDWRYATADEMRLYALSATDGSVRWSAALPGGTEQIGIPSVSGGRVVVLTEDDRSNPTGEDDWQVSAFDAASGQALWRQTPTSAVAQLGHGLSFPPHVAPYTTDDHAFLDAGWSRDGGLAVFEMASGRLVKAAPAIILGEHSTLAPMTAAAGRIFVATLDTKGRRLVALDEGGWAELWGIPLDDSALGEARSGPFHAATSELVFSVQGRDVVAYDAATGAPRFGLDERQDQATHQLTIVDDTLYRLTGKDTVVAYDAATGRQRWTYTRPLAGDGGLLTSFSVADATLIAYCACHNGDREKFGAIIALDAIDGRERWHQVINHHRAIFFDQPVLIDGLVITPDDDDTLVARSTGDGSVHWRLPRALGRGPAASGGLVFATDLAPRWHHWLIALGMPRPA